MIPALIRLLGAYALLLALLAAEFFAAFSALHGQTRFLLLVPALLMAAVVLTGFMALPRAGAPVIMFATAAVLWLAILLGLGLLDPVTRAMFPTSGGAHALSRESP